MRTAAVPPPLPPLPLSAEPLPGSDLADRLSWYASTARWAPSKHNTQPWRFVVRRDCVEVWSDPMRILPATDPHRREMTISCGAAVHLACVAARGIGYRPIATALPDGPGGPLARLVEAGAWKTTPADRALLEAVWRRRTDRGPLDAEQLPPSLPFLLQTSAAEQGATLRLLYTPGDRATLAGLTGRADRLLVLYGGVHRELAGWLREEGDLRPDGVPTDHTRGPAASYRAEFLQRDFSGPTGRARPSQDRPGADRPIVGILATASDSTRDWLVAGQALASVLLSATVNGASASYLNQSVENPAIRARLREQLTHPDVPQLVLRIGAGGAVTPPPRRAVDEVTFSS
ncbi:MAG: hypothetical protein M3N21_09475 [Actinomycetota bacterium]|nr:hypothetical protein [Actinomycetota bacterium]